MLGKADLNLKVLNMNNKEEMEMAESSRFDRLCRWCYVCLAVVYLFAFASLAYWIRQEADNSLFFLMGIFLFWLWDQSFVPLLFRMGVNKPETLRAAATSFIPNVVLKGAYALPFLVYVYSSEQEEPHLPSIVLFCAIALLFLLPDAYRVLKRSFYFPSNQEVECMMRQKAHKVLDSNRNVLFLKSVWGICHLRDIEENLSEYAAGVDADDYYEVRVYELDVDRMAIEAPTPKIIYFLLERVVDFHSYEVYGYIDKEEEGVVYLRVDENWHVCFSDEVAEMETLPYPEGWKESAHLSKSLFAFVEMYEPNLL